MKHWAGSRDDLRDGYHGLRYCGGRANGWSWCRCESAEADREAEHHSSGCMLGKHHCWILSLLFFQHVYDDQRKAIEVIDVLFKKSATESFVLFYWFSFSLKLSLSGFILLETPAVLRQRLDSPLSWEFCWIEFIFINIDEHFIFYSIFLSVWISPLGDDKVFIYHLYSR